ncbi:MAG: hypothetical protein FWC79_04845 [Oscillospiraceae bacterium]|nr:hypothetical protein [Oscillospiraceae bacterium]
MRQISIGRKKRMRNMILVSFIILFGLVIRIGFIQFVQGAELQAMAHAQQTLNRRISPRRGTIWDATGENVLAMSASAETVTVNPRNIPTESRSKVAKAMADIFDLDYEEITRRLSRNSAIETIVRRVSKEYTDELRIWMNENNITTGINIDEDTKRVYPHSTLASNVIGFTGIDDQGLEGLEKYYDEILRGEPGRILRMADATRCRLGSRRRKLYSSSAWKRYCAINRFNCTVNSRKTS